MRKFLGLFFAVLLLDVLILYWMIAPAHSSPRPIIIEPPDRLMPGQALPGDANCFHEPYAYWTKYLVCRVDEPMQDIYIGYDYGKGMIVSTSLLLRDLTIGDLIAAWGTPTGLKRTSYSADVTWGRRSSGAVASVWVYGRQFSPTSELLVLSYSLADATRWGPWRGFVNAER